MDLFDLHCDTLVKYRELGEGFLCGDTQFSLREKEGLGRMCQTMAVFVPDRLRGREAEAYFDSHCAYLKELLKREEDLAAQVWGAGDIERITGEGRLAVILSVESGAALGGRLERVEELYRQGVRFMTLVWNGENELGSGHDTEKGLTEFGRRAVRRMEELKMVVDVSHLNDRGFEDLCEIASRPFVATHSNLRSVAGHRRNLREDQFKEIVRRQGLVGVNLYKRFLDDEGRGTRESLYRHIYRMLELGGEDVIACGSDFDGADIGEELDSPAKLASMAEELLARGIRETVVDKIFFGNALKFCQRNL